MQSSIFKRITGLVLLGILFLSTVGCASKTGAKKSNSVFAMPTWKDESKPKKPKKDPGTPVTMGEAMMLPRNDVL